MTCNYYFILKDKEAIETDALAWGRWFGWSIEQRIVAKSKGADVQFRAILKNGGKNARIRMVIKSSPNERNRYVR